MLPKCGNFDFRPKKTIETVGREHFQSDSILVETTDGVEGDGSFELQEDGRYRVSWKVWTGDVPRAMKAEMEKRTGLRFTWQEDKPPPGFTYQGQGMGSAYLVPDSE